MIRLAPSHAEIVLAAFSLLAAGPRRASRPATPRVPDSTTRPLPAPEAGAVARPSTSSSTRSRPPMEGRPGLRPFLESPDAIPHLGLQWEETRYLSEVAIDFAEGSEVPPEAEIVLEYWWLTWLNPGHVSPACRKRGLLRRRLR